MTLTPDHGYRLHSPQYCLRLTPAQLRMAAAHLLAGAPELLNVLLFVPLGFFLVLSTRRAGLAAVIVTVLPVPIELFQAGVAQRVCSPLDWLDNTLGGLIGVAAGVVMVVVRRRETRPGALARSAPDRLA